MINTLRTWWNVHRPSPKKNAYCHVMLSFRGSQIPRSPIMDPVLKSQFKIVTRDVLKVSAHLYFLIFLKWKWDVLKCMFSKKSPSAIWYTYLKDIAKQIHYVVNLLKTKRLWIRNGLSYKALSFLICKME